MASGGGRAEALEDGGMNAYTHYLKATNFGFSIPSTATIDGIIVEIKRFCEEDSSVRDSRVSIVKATGAIGATSYQKGGYWPTDLIYYSYGGITDTWNESWTYANINSSNFGVVLQARVGAYKRAKVDHIRIKVYYSVPIDYEDICTDTISCSDTVVENEEGNDVLTDTITCSDAVVESFGAVDGAIDTITCTDSMSESFGAVDVVTDTIACADSITEILDAIDILTDTITCTDSIIQNCCLFDTFIDTVSIDDVLIEIHTWPIQTGAHNLTFTEFLSDLKVQFGNRTDLETPTNLYGVWINLAYKEIVTRHRWWERKVNFKFPQLETDTYKERLMSASKTTAGIEYIPVPANALVIRNVWNETNDRMLDKIASWKEYVDCMGRANPNARGKPTEWIRNGIYIYLYLTPDATYPLRIYYRKIPPDLILGSDVTLIGEEWDEIILLGAKIRGKSWLGNADKKELQGLKDEWRKQVDGLIGIYLQEQRDIEAKAEPAQEGLNFDFYL